MPNLNKVFLMGNLTKDPELRYTAGGAPVANLRLAINRVYQLQSGEKKEDVCFVTVVVWRKQAEAVGQYLKKGTPSLLKAGCKAEHGKPRTSRNAASWKWWPSASSSSTAARAAPLRAPTRPAVCTALIRMS